MSCVYVSVCVCVCMCVLYKTHGKVQVERLADFGSVYSTRPIPMLCGLNDCVIVLLLGLGCIA